VTDGRIYDQLHRPPATPPNRRGQTVGVCHGHGRPRSLISRPCCQGCEPREACIGTCEDCPQILNQPKSHEGWQVWDLVARLGSQLRVAPMGGIIGWDMGAALALAAALGIDPAPVAELLPAIEAVMVKKLNERAASGDLEWDDV